MPARLKLLLDRPWLVALLFAVAAELLFAAWLDLPHQLSFDETHYVPAARTLLALEGPRNIEHPLLAKELIALGITIFGDNPWGWRLPGTIAGAATVAGSFVFLWLLVRDMRAAAAGALMVMLNQMLLVMARTAMLDVYLGAFLVWALAAFTWSARAPPGRAMRGWIAGSALLGLAVGVKWAAIPYTALACLAFVALRARDNWAALFPLRPMPIAGPRPRSTFDPRGIPALLAGKGQRHWQGIATIPGLLILGVVSIATYLLTFLPAFFYASEPMTLDQLIPFQFIMYERQTQTLQPHPYQSQWWSWPLMLRPLWYFYEWDAGAWRGVLLIGNPVILWGGLIAVGACLYAWFRHRTLAPLAVALLWIASVAIFIVIPKSLGFFYYYHPSAIFICYAIAIAFREWRGLREAEPWFLGVAALAFVYFYPILAAMPLVDGGGFNYWMWFGAWR
ncbi:glycosyltransferase family 39 protein [Sphingomonas canadensis]|uniref:Polyprenol-phosphate-mannose--protein mannosyltransferase n=1 Tax=Sphingomonas canadensis TaxID=1219257 RepID=A0ABW3H497_9SPHN|nr:glycosyltransferase family 39 protein [Sphingomonas canadensis]MCW3836020.1 glycosyltransferase family 39 protein [Sphingomonas canadensis]